MNNFIYSVHLTEDNMHAYYYYTQVLNYFVTLSTWFQ